ncbi:hypothetical protein D3C72_705960 [compost metagenome]
MPFQQSITIRGTDEQVRVICSSGTIDGARKGKPGGDIQLLAYRCRYKRMNVLFGTVQFFDVEYIAQFISIRQSEDAAAQVYLGLFQPLCV